jgi:hypothetical protein
MNIFFDRCSCSKNTRINQQDAISKDYKKAREQVIESLDVYNLINSVDSLKRAINKMKLSLRNMELQMNLPNPSKDIPYLFARFQNLTAEGDLKKLNTSKMDENSTQLLSKKSTVKTNAKEGSLNSSIEEAKLQRSREWEQKEGKEPASVKDWANSIRSIMNM